MLLKRAATSRPSGKWNDDYYDVLADGVIVGRIEGGGSRYDPFIAGPTDMSYTTSKPTEPCTVCGSAANIPVREFGVGVIVDCARCGDFQISHVTADDLGLPFSDPKQLALASYAIRKMQASSKRPKLSREFFASLNGRTLPTPAEASDNLLIWIAEKADGRPSAQIQVTPDPGLLATIGVVEPGDVAWIFDSLKSQRLLNETFGNKVVLHNLTAKGWQRFEDLKRARVSSNFAFFARKFDNPDLDQVFDKCLRDAVAQTGYELRTVTQRAGLVDAVIEDEIRRCRFLIADLSDDNAGAYWEAGFAEGLGKPVIYICRSRSNGEEKKTHFDANHRQTVRWDLSSLDQTATKLKAVIRNALLGDAKQAD